MTDDSREEYWVAEQREVVKQLRESTGRTVRSLAEVASRSPQSWSGYENDRRIPPERLKELMQLAPAASEELHQRAQRLLVHLEQRKKTGAPETEGSEKEQDAEQLDSGDVRRDDSGAGDVDNGLQSTAPSKRRRPEQLRALYGLGVLALTLTGVFVWGTSIGASRHSPLSPTAPAAGPTPTPTASTPVTPRRSSASDLGLCDRYRVTARDMSLRTQDNIPTGQVLVHDDIATVERRGTPTGDTELWYVTAAHAHGWIHPDDRYLRPAC